MSDADFADIQGLARFGHGHLPHARFHLLRIADAGAARAWLAARIKPERDDADPALVTTAVKGKLPKAALQVAFTYQGLQALDVPDSALKRFSYEFMDGMAGEIDTAVAKAVKRLHVSPRCPRAAVNSQPVGTSRNV